MLAAGCSELWQKKQISLAKKMLCTKNVALASLKIKNCLEKQQTHTP